MTPAAFFGTAMFSLLKPGNRNRVSRLYFIDFHRCPFFTGPQLMEVNPDAIPEKIYPHIQF